MTNKKVTIKSGRLLSSIIENIMNESIKSSLHKNGIDEKEYQKKMLGEEDDDLSGSSDEGSGSGGESKTVSDEKEKLKSGEVESKDVIDRLNTIRSGKSFKDESISKQMEEYVDSLSQPEKVALLAFLKGISQIVTGEIESGAATDPSDPEPSISMEKGQGQKKSIKPNVIKAPPKDKKTEKPTEDTSGPVPITPKK
jgi:hypothetical protein